MIEGRERRIVESRIQARIGEAALYCVLVAAVVECVQQLNDSRTHAVSDEIRYRVLSYLNEHPDASQRDLANHLGVSVGKVNYCLQALIARGWLKMQNFRSKSANSRRLSYRYNLTPKGIEEKVNVTLRFLRRKIEEYDALSAEIERLGREVNAGNGADVEPGSASR